MSSRATRHEPQDNTRKLLSSLGKKLSELIPRLPAMNDVLDLATGALFGLMKARELDYLDRPGILPPKYWSNLKLRLQGMAHGRLPRGGFWLAGFYFNSAIQRIDAARDRTCGLIRRMDRQLKRNGQSPAKVMAHPNLGSVAEEVQRMKHDPAGLYSGRKVSFTQAVEALAEFVKIVEARARELGNSPLQQHRNVGPRRRMARQ